MNVERFLHGQARQSVWWAWGLLAFMGVLRVRRAIPRDYVLELPSRNTWRCGFAMPWRWRRDESPNATLHGSSEAQRKEIP
jgi:hypothetical protein